MTVPRALDEPLTDAELDELEAFLASDAVPQDCMDLEMLDGYLAAIASGPEQIQPSEWLQQVWSEGGKSSTPAFTGTQQAQRIMALMLRHMVGIERTLAESPTRFKPLLYIPDEHGRDSERSPPEGTAWCEGYMSGVKLRDEEWQPLYDTERARDWIFPIEALAFGEQDDEFTEWVDSDEKRAGPDRRAADRGGADLPVLAGPAQRRADDRGRPAPQPRRGDRAQVAPAPALTAPVGGSRAAPAAPSGPVGRPGAASGGIPVTPRAPPWPRSARRPSSIRAASR